MLDEVIANPGWLITEAGEVSGTLAEVLQSTVAVLRKHGDHRLSAAVGRDVLQEALKSVVLRQEFVTSRVDGRMLVARTVEAVVSTVFDKGLDSRAAWQLVRGEVVTALSKLALEKMAGSGLDRDAVAKLHECLAVQVESLKKGEVFALDQFAGCLDEALNGA